MAIDKTFIKLSRKLRKDETPWERILWMHLKSGRFLGLKFKRQLVIGPYMYDFSCFEKKLIIELDGSQHLTKEISIKDKEKEAFVKKLGYRVIRIYNNDIQNNLEAVLESIRIAST